MRKKISMDYSCSVFYTDPEKEDLSPREKRYLQRLAIEMSDRNIIHQRKLLIQNITREIENMIKWMSENPIDEEETSEEAGEGTQQEGVKVAQGDDTGLMTRGRKNRLHRLFEREINLLKIKLRELRVSEQELASAQKAGKNRKTKKSRKYKNTKKTRKTKKSRNYKKTRKLYK
jgi:hypothetical protein